MSDPIAPDELHAPLSVAGCFVLFVLPVAFWVWLVAWICHRATT